MMAKKPKVKKKVMGNKIPKFAKDPDSYFKLNPTWRLQKADKDCSDWKVCQENLNDGILEKLSSFENMTWGEILSASGGRSHGTNSHFVSTDKLIRKAQKRLKELKIYEEELLSLRLSGRIRIWGILRKGIFYILWIDLNHEICKSEKK